MSAPTRQTRRQIARSGVCKLGISAGHFSQYPTIKYMSNETDPAKAMSQAAGNSAADLIARHWNRIEAAMPASGKITVSIRLNLKKCGTAYKQKFCISYGSKTTDEREDTIDPSQMDLEGTK